jgi:type I site-specific restriction-modification system R (restriction) subunit
LNPCRPDLLGFLNCLPLVAIELKKPGVPARGVARKQTGRNGTMALLPIIHK